jgi:ABC-type xylose transport system permease subunit
MIHAVCAPLGATLALDGGEGGILGSMLGALVMAFLRSGSQQMGWPTTCRRA